MSKKILINEFLPIEVFIDEHGKFYCRSHKIEIKKYQSGCFLMIFLKNHLTKSFLAHKLIAKYLIPNPNNYKLVLFKDKNKFNLEPNNLIWSNTPYLPGQNKKRGQNKPKVKKKKVFKPLPREKWKSHPSFEGIEVSSFGRVKRGDNLLRVVGRIDHYPKVRIENKNKRIHILVAETFLKKKTPEHNQVNHKDGNKGNNHISNLEWVTAKGNSEDKKKRNYDKKQIDQKQAIKSYLDSGLTLAEINCDNFKPLENLLDGSFEVSPYGVVRRKFKYKNGEIKYYYKLAELNQDGYLEVRLSKGNSRNKETFRQVRKGIHQLVALAFIPNPENKPTVNHIDKNILNNRVENLNWATVQEQNEHKVKKVS